MSPPPTAADSPEVRARIAEGLTLVPSVMRQLRVHFSSAIDPDDVESHAREGALLAARSFDESRGVPFRRWASLRIRGAVIDGLRRQGDLPRRLYERLRALEAANQVEESMLEQDAAAPPSTPELADTRLSEYLATMATALASGSLLVRDDERLDELIDERPPPDEELARARLREAVREAIATRPEVERAIVDKYYFDGMTLEQAAKELGFSKSWASRMLTRAIEGITRALERRHLAGD